MFSDISTAIVVTVSVLPVLAFLAVALRLSKRRTEPQSLAADDYLIVVALIILICSCAGYIAGVVVGGIGSHHEMLESNTVVTFLKITFALQFLYLLAVTVIKLSVLLFYRRIFFVSPGFRIAVNIMCCLVLAWFITFFFATLLQTLPISGNWELGPHQGITINKYSMYISGAVLEITLDIVTLILPLFVIWRLQMHTTQKWQVSGMFLLGSFICVASILRLYYLVVRQNPTVEKGEDLTYNLGVGKIVLWSAIEPLVGVTCACLPMLGHIFRRRTLQSILRSLGSFFELRSRQSAKSQFSRSTQSRHSEPTIRPMDDQQNLVTTEDSYLDQGKSSDDTPLQNIMVSSSLQSDTQQRPL